MEPIKYIFFNGREFAEFVTLVKLMCSKDKGKQSKSVVLSVEDDKLVCRASDDAFNLLEYNITLYKNDNQINDPISLSINDLYVFVKNNSDEKFAIRNAHGQCEVRIIGGGWMPVSTFKFNMSKYNVDGEKQEIGKVNSIKFRNAISTVLGYTQDYTYARDKFIQFSKNSMVVTSRLSSVVMSDEFIDVTLHRDDAAVLKSLLKDNFDLSVDRITSDSIKRVQFSGPNFKFTTVENSIDASDIKYNDSINNYISVDCGELFKLVTFSEEYSASKQIVGLSIKNKELNVSIKNKFTVPHSSIIKSTIVGDIPNAVEEIKVPSHNLYKALKLFQDKHSRNANIYIPDKSVIIIFDDNMQSTINCPQ